MVELGEGGGGVALPINQCMVVDNLEKYVECFTSYARIKEKKRK